MRPVGGSGASATSRSDPAVAAGADAGPASRPGRAAAYVRSHPWQLALVAFAALWGAVQCYDLGFEPMWQDELSSLGAAQAVRAHLLPRWPSGFLYWKSELYSALIAVVGWFVHDDVAWLRSVSTLFFAGTVALFGLGLAPLVLPGRRAAQLLSTVVFATAPFELGHARGRAYVPDGAILRGPARHPAVARPA